MNNIYKYSLYDGKNQIFVLYGTVKILTVKMQQGRPYVWIEHDTSIQISETIHITQISTGCAIPDGAEYIDTTLDADYVWHWYKVR